VLVKINTKVKLRLGENEIDDLVADILGLMQHFRTLLENKVYLKQYAA